MIARAASLLALGLAVVFAAAGVALLRSHDPVTATVPFALAIGMGWSASWGWPRVEFFDDGLWLSSTGPGGEPAGVAESAVHGGEAPAAADG